MSKNKTKAHTINMLTRSLCYTFDYFAQTVPLDCGLIRLLFTTYRGFEFTNALKFDFVLKLRFPDSNKLKKVICNSCANIV